MKGSDRKVPETRQAVIGGKSVALKLTGAGVREKAFFNVYVIASYIDSGASPHSAGELAGADSAKQMVLTLERDVEGETMAAALSEAFRANYATGMDAELGKVEAFLKANNLSKGDEIVFTAQPDGTMTGYLSGKSPVTTKSAGFAKAFWEIWLGGHPVQADIKTGPTARL